MILIRLDIFPIRHEIINSPKIPEVQRQKEAEAEEKRLLEVENEKLEAEERARKMSEMLKYQFERGAEESAHRND
uniref:Uncharacterized protein n=1 Tax=Caenorhabditis japonica TaxID=281687 RepID=A0A8R1EP89_CAEJA